MADDRPSDSAADDIFHQLSQLDDSRRSEILFETASFDLIVTENDDEDEDDDDDMLVIDDDGDGEAELIKLNKTKAVLVSSFKPLSVIDYFVEGEEEYEEWKPSIGSIRDSVFDETVDEVGEESEVEEDEEEEEEEEEELGEEVDEEEMTKLAQLAKKRLSLIENIKGVMDERKILKRKNGYLQKKCCDNIRRRKLFSVIERVPTDHYALYENERYKDVLAEYGETLDYVSSRKPIYETEINEINQNYMVLVTKLDEIFKELTSREFEVGIATVSMKTGRVLTDREVMRLLRRQKERAKDLSNTRILYLKRRNRLAEINTQIYDSNVLGPGYSSMDYEQLAVLSQMASEKLEDRKEEIRKLREKTFASISILGQMKEKLDALMSDIGDADVKLTIVTAAQDKQRFYSAQEKWQRDIKRKKYNRMREAAGLVTHPVLLSQMEFRLAKYMELKNETMLLQAEVRMQNRQTSEMKSYLQLRRAIMGSNGTK